MNLGDFIDRYRTAIAARVIESYPPVYQPNESPPLPRLLRVPMGAQAEAIAGAALSLQTNMGTTIVGEMGTGKTYIGAAAAHMAGYRTPLVVCPPHLTNKWKREIEDTVPMAQAIIVSSITDLRQLHNIPGRGELPIYTILSRERAKLSFRWRPAYVTKWATWNGALAVNELNEPYRRPHCPNCNHAIVDKDGIPLKFAQLNRRKHVCEECKGPLWEADNDGPKRYALSDFIKNHMKGFFDLFIGDEIHEYKSRGSAQGIAAGVLAQSCGNSLSLTGTLLGGYSSTIFHLLYRFTPEIRRDYPHNGEKLWISHYGFEEHTMGKPQEGDEDDGRTSRRRGFKKVTREKPGLIPTALFHIINNTVFLKLSDVASALPDYEEQIMISPLDTEKPEGQELSQATAYYALFEVLRRALKDALLRGSKKMLATYLQTLLAYPDACTKGETVFNPDFKDDPNLEHILAQVPPLAENKLYPKEKQLIDLVTQEKAAGRRVLTYVTHTGTRDITPRMQNILEQQGFTVAVMKADKVAPNKREKWIEDKVNHGIDVLICHPRLVQTGLDLIDFPTIVWCEVEYSVYVMRQASRRSWRIGQTQPVKVIYMSYQGTLQSDALRLVAKKLQSSLAVEGDLPEDGLATYGDDGDDMMMMLAKKIVAADDTPIEEQSLDQLFTTAQAIEKEEEQLLVADDWQATAPEREIEIVEEPDAPPIEAVPEIAAEDTIIKVAPKPNAQQQSLLSWTDFLKEKPAKPKRKKKQETQSMSLFDFAAELQQETVPA